MITGRTKSYTYIGSKFPLRPCEDETLLLMHPHGNVSAWVAKTTVMSTHSGGFLTRPEWHFVMEVRPTRPTFTQGILARAKHRWLQRLGRQKQCPIYPVGYLKNTDEIARALLLLKDSRDAQVLQTSMPG